MYVEKERDAKSRVSAPWTPACTVAGGEHRVARTTGLCRLIKGQGMQTFRTKGVQTSGTQDG
eukprot:scaffold148253_cov17-Tisochrysis_lutea.AAC.1